LENITIFHSYYITNGEDAETHFLAHSTVLACICYRSYTQSKCCFTLNQWAWSVPVTWQRRRSRHARKSLAIRKLHGAIFYRNGVIADW